ncbi:chloride channel protein [Clostridium felsineum]|uniref:chloride channel protein n=1 Tax=Clostridium felsineum TaxID=36839 RepID=UPI00098C6418|nr:chloride channel protein [Clostridium felsineum]URZ02208.1 Chloride/fluoride channel protein [Clostridium felsineum]
MKYFKKFITEESILILSALKWIFLSAAIGALVGGLTTEFVKLINITTGFTFKFRYYYLFLPIGLFLSNFIINLLPEAKGHGTEKAIKSVNENKGNMDIKVVPIKLLTTLITIIFGGSVGLEGPATQIGGTISSFLGSSFKMNTADKRRLVVCGISAGFVSVFNAPIGAAIFACEVLYIGKLSYISLLPSLISSFTSYYTGLYLGNKPLSFPISYVPKNQFKAFVGVLIFSFIVGIASILFIKLVEFIDMFFRKLKIYPPLKGIIGGAIIIVLVTITGSTETLGIGDNVFTNAVLGTKTTSNLFLTKSLTTSLTLGCGGSGGILTPMLFIGSTLGNAFAQLIHSNLVFYSAIGMVAFLAACSNVPISSIVIAIELFGGNIGLYASIAIGISYIIVGHASIYPTQFIMTSKTPSLDVETNISVNNLHSFNVSDKSHSFLKIINKFKN